MEFVSGPIFIQVKINIGVFLYIYLLLLYKLIKNH